MTVAESARDDVVVDDPDEGLDADGLVVTGARRDRIPAPFEPLVGACVDALEGDALGVVSVHVYGSVATGRAIPGRSDLDLLLVLAEGASGRRVSDLLEPLTDPALVREIGVSTVPRAVVLADDDRGRIERCFLTSYAVRLAGEEVLHTRCRGDRDLATGFAGDLLDRLPRLASGQLDGADPVGVARRLLLVAAMHLSVQQGEWSTDRARTVELLAATGTDIGEEARRAAATLFAHVDSRGSHFGIAPPVRDIAVLAGWLHHDWPREQAGLSVVGEPPRGDDVEGLLDRGAAGSAVGPGVGPPPSRPDRP